MTDSARQDSTKTSADSAGAGSAEAGSAATRGAAVTSGAAVTESGPAAEAKTEQAETAVTAGETAETDLDETKRKFREALERKHQAHTESQGKGGRDSGKVSGAHGPAASRRNFRRKSG